MEKVNVKQQQVHDILFNREIGWQEIIYDLINSKKLEKIELNEQIPELIPKSPMPRFKRVSLKELMEALGKAIITENRRIKKEIVKHGALREIGISFPKRKLSIQDKIKQIFSKIIYSLEENKNEKKIHYNHIIGEEKHERIFSFALFLYLEHQKKIWLEQNAHFEDI